MGLYINLFITESDKAVKEGGNKFDDYGININKGARVKGGVTQHNYGCGSGNLESKGTVEGDIGQINHGTCVGKGKDAKWISFYIWS